MSVIRATAMVALISAPAALSAAGFGIGVGVGSTFRTTVTPLKDGVYEVAAHGSSAPVAYWCGIGDYAIRTLGTKATQRIYITKPYEPGVRTVQFSLTPPPDVDTKPGYSVTVKKLGANMTAGSAQTRCYDNLIDRSF